MTAKQHLTFLESFDTTGIRYVMVKLSVIRDHAPASAISIIKPAISIKTVI